VNLTYAKLEVVLFDSSYTSKYLSVPILVIFRL
ncbi:MAG: hypothetical protein QG610_1480, partial [Euryarchaeota archaeon]|nr:hypothetical protein [Euryarchaeota archaeon]